MDQTRSDIALLYRRAGFGALPAELDVLATGGYPAAVEGLLAGTGTAPDGPGDALAVPVFAPYVRSTAGRGTPAALAAARARNAQLRTELAALQSWWLDRMIVTATPLREKLTLLWHGHFATGVSKVRDAGLMYKQNQLFRTAGAGSFETLTQAVAKDGAMMLWLDTDTDKAAHPNENFARELMELFTLGIGNYTQADVTAAARSFTGWTFDRVTGQFRLQARQHDTGSKTFLGRTGDLGGEDVISIIVGQPASARFVAAGLWSHLAYPVTPSDPVVTDLVAAYGSGFDLTAQLRAIFLHPAFRSPTTRAGLVKQPIEYLVGAARSLGLDSRLQPAGTAGSTPAGIAPATSAGSAAGAPHAGPTLATLATSLAQTPFDPPNVGGWPQNAYWLNSATALARLRVATQLARRADLSAVADAPVAQRPGVVAGLLGIDGWGPTTLGALAQAAPGPEALVTLALTAPEYVLN